MPKFKLISDYKPTLDQKNAISNISKGLKNGLKHQVLLGVTGSGKTFTVANVIKRLQRPTLIISHNKTLAAQLYQEFRDYFPENAVSYFVSYYDYYQPEAYLPSTDTYIEKDAGINELIDKLRLAATTNLLTRRDTIIISSVSCIYNIGSPSKYKKFVFEFGKGLKISRDQIIDRLLDLHYERNDYEFKRGSFRIRGENIDIFLSYSDEAIRIILENDFIKLISIINPITGQIINEDVKEKLFVYPSKHYIADANSKTKVFSEIKRDLNKRKKELLKNGKLVEADRLEKKVRYDLEMIAETGYVKGVENYSRYFDGRKPGDPPYTLLDYFNHPYGDDWLCFVDESHITFPQIRGMYYGDLSRKKTLIDYGFRLPAAIDNRPLTFDEFLRKIPNSTATSATPSEWKINLAKSESKSNKKIQYNGITEQLLRPTGIPDPLVEIKPTKNQVMDVIDEIKYRKNKKQRSLITTLTKKTAEDLSQYLKEQGLNVQYLHSDIKTMERSDILDDLRKGKYDSIIGVNLLREGLDLPEVSLVAILDADKEGFLRSEVSLIQTMGRASRHVDGTVILYADKVTGSIRKAIREVTRRRKYQLKINKKHGIKPISIKKPIREKLIDQKDLVLDLPEFYKYKKDNLDEINKDSLTPMDINKLVKKLKTEMRLSAHDLNFELAAKIRDKILELEK